MEWQDDPQGRAPMTEAIEETEKLRARVAELEAEVDESRKLLSHRVEADRLSEANSIIAKLEAENERLRERQKWIDEVARPNHPDDERPWCAAYLDTKAENERLKTMYAAHIGDEHDNCWVAVNQRLREALKSISRNTCCDKCQEAARVAKAALEVDGGKA